MTTQVCCCYSEIKLSTDTHSRRETHEWLMMMFNKNNKNVMTPSHVSVCVHAYVRAYVRVCVRLCLHKLAQINAKEHTIAQIHHHRF